MNPFRLLFILLFSSLAFQSVSQSIEITSPDNKIRIQFQLTQQGEATYLIYFNQELVLKTSRLGLLIDKEDFARGLELIKADQIEEINDKYELHTGKKTLINYTAHRRTIQLRNSSGKKINVIFQVSDDGVAFRYHFPEKDPLIKNITEEFSSFRFDTTTTKGFLQPMQVSKSGWEKTNPAYEEHYRQNIPIIQKSPFNTGWVYPALYQTKSAWVLITEASVDSNYCATRLHSASPDGEFRIGFPDIKELKTGGGILPKITTPYYTPWRIITIGSLKTIVESTLGTDLAQPAISMDKSFIRPGKSSWSWIMSKDDSIVYSEQIRYVDFAAKMKWQYCLVDADWDRKIGYEKIKELAQYAASKKVGLLLWYNSAGDWNTVKYTPKNKLLTHEERVKEFTRLKEIGIKGIKIDFFGGDGQSVMQYYLEILQDAARFELMVNFHGATLPRGWQRTYPNLLTTEAVRGFEMVTFTQADADAQANHCAMLPFTRNAFDPMDFTPMNLYKIPTKVIRKTSSGFELATSVLFYSGIQHFAESPDGMNHVPWYVQNFLKKLPTQWDDVKFIDGYPGKYVVLARRSFNTWYIAGINAEPTEKIIDIDLSTFNKKSAVYITDGIKPLSFATETLSVDKNDVHQIILKPLSGFVIVLK